MLKLIDSGDHEWEFGYPRQYRDLFDEFDRGCEFFEKGDLKAAEESFRKVLASMPAPLDAIHHLAMVLSERRLWKQARELWEQAVRIGRKAFPRDFRPGRDKLPWVMLDNRPFLRCLHGLALERYEDEKLEEALGLFQEMLQLNPNDNQGVRAVVQELLFTMGRFEEALWISEHYPSDIMPETLYGRALALFKLGRRREATRALKEAVDYRPLVRKELLKKTHRRPKSEWPDLIAVGSAGEAHEYWRTWRRIWEADPEALEWLRETAGAPRRKRT